MSWERVTCPFCGRSVAVSPAEQRMAWHSPDRRITGASCEGSFTKFADARLHKLDYPELIAVVRGGIIGRVAVEALDDLEAKIELDTAAYESMLASCW